MWAHDNDAMEEIGVRKRHAFVSNIFSGAGSLPKHRDAYFTGSGLEVFSTHLFFSTACLRVTRPNSKPIAKNVSRHESRNTAK